VRRDGDHPEILRPLARGCKASGVTVRERILRVVRRIPRGRVMSYGAVARTAGVPGAARQVGYALAALRDGSDVPWQRVLNARGEVSLRHLPGADLLQRKLLEAEGVRFDARGRVDLARFAWRPASRPRKSKPRVARRAASRRRA
jgi:methylated-DNA-protein-cysteine methyltransferase-like protein